MKQVHLRRLAGLVVSATLVAVTVGVGSSAGGATLTAEPAPAGDSVDLDTQLPGSFGESGVPTPFVAVVTNLGAARPNVQLSLRLTRFHGVTAEHFDIEFRNPATGTWRALELRDEADGSAITGRTAPFALAAARVSTLNLRFAYHPGEFDATLLEVREVAFEMTLVENGPDGPIILDTDFDVAPVLRMAVYFTGVPARLRAGVSDTFAIRYTNASENRYQPVRPSLSIDPILSDVDVEDLTLEWQHPQTKAWSVVPVVENDNGPSAQFTEEHAIEARPQSTTAINLRLTVATGVTGGRIRLYASGYVPVDRGFGLNYNQTYVTVTP
jgi:hypothetical protein